MGSYYREVLSHIDPALVPPEAAGAGQFGNDSELYASYKDVWDFAKQLTTIYRSLRGYRNERLGKLLDEHILDKAAEYEQYLKDRFCEKNLQQDAQELDQMKKAQKLDQMKKAQEWRWRLYQEVLGGNDDEDKEDIDIDRFLRSDHRCQAIANLDQWIPAPASVRSTASDVAYERVARASGRKVQTVKNAVKRERACCRQVDIEK